VIIAIYDSILRFAAISSPGISREDEMPNGTGGGYEVDYGNPPRGTVS
jgi:hypothetical protein